MALSLSCAWCGTPLLSQSDPNAPVSHGICPTCAAAFRNEAGLTVPAAEAKDVPFPPAKVVR